MAKINKDFGHHICGIVGIARSFAVVFSRIKGGAAIIYSIITTALLYAPIGGLPRGTTLTMLGISTVTTVI